MSLSFDCAKEIARRHRGVTPETVIRIVNLRHKGNSFSGIGRTVGLKKDTVRRIWKEAKQKLVVIVAPEKNKMTVDLVDKVEREHEKIAAQLETRRLERELLFCNLQTCGNDIVNQVLKEIIMRILNRENLTSYLEDYCRVEYKMSLEETLEVSAREDGITAQNLLNFPEWYDRWEREEDYHGMMCLRAELRARVQESLRSAREHHDWICETWLRPFVIEACQEPGKTVEQYTKEAARGHYLNRHDALGWKQTPYCVYIRKKEHALISFRVWQYLAICKRDSEATRKYHLNLRGRQSPITSSIGCLVEKGRAGYSAHQEALNRQKSCSADIVTISNICATVKLSKPSV